MRERGISLLAATSLAFASGLAGAERAHADPSGYTLERLAFEGDPDPLLGSLNQLVGEVDLDEDGRVTFASYVDDGVDVYTKIFRVQGGALASEVASGDAVPGMPGLVFSDVGRPHNAAPGILAYLGIYEDGLGDSRSGAFLRTGSGQVAMAVPGTPAPAGGAIAQLLSVHAATAAGSAAISALVDDGGASPVPAQMVYESGGLREIYRDGAPAPAEIGGSYSGVQGWWIPALLANGTAFFYSEVTGGSVASGIFQASPAGVVTPVLLAGDPVTTPGGGTFDSFFPMVGENGAGDLAIAAYIQRSAFGFSPQALFVLEGATQREIVLRGDPIPGTSPERFFLQLAGSGPPGLDATGRIAFGAILTDQTESAFEHALLLDDRGALAVLAREGDPVPGVPGASFSDFLQVASNDAGAIAFYAFTTGGNGVFLATPPPQIPLAPPLALLALALGLGTAGRLQRRRTR